MPRRIRSIAIAIALVFSGHPGIAKEISVTSNEALLRAARGADPGDTVLLEGGPFSGIHLDGIRGSEGRPIVISGRSAEQPARFRGGNTALHLSGAQFVTLRFLDVQGARINGINIDDAGDKTTPAIGIRIEDCSIADTGGRGNHDALKLSGVDEFEVSRCRFSGWGGSGIDMVGCHDGVIRNCRFAGKAGFAASNAVQTKGGSARIAILQNRFEKAGQRAINIGGSTGLDYFRPKVGDFEAKDIEVAGNFFIGGMAPIAWVTCDGGHVHHNTILKPEKWVVRILQENGGKGFKPAHGGVFEHNIVVFDRAVRTFANVGAGTAPETFRFRNNAWFEESDRRRGRRPVLPTAETGGVYGVDPQLRRDGSAAAKDPSLQGKGAMAYDRRPQP